jgi:hypothetical protein
LEHSGHLDAAVLDIKLRDGVVYPVAEALQARSVPFVFTTGYGEHAIPDRYKDVALPEALRFGPACTRIVFRCAPNPVAGMASIRLSGQRCCVADPQRLDGAYCTA